MSPQGKAGNSRSRCPRACSRGHATNGIRQQAIRERQAIVGPCLENAVREAEFQERAVEQFARKIARERAAGPICAAKSGREAYDEQPAIGVTERRHGRVVPAGLALPRRLPECDEPGAGRAISVRAPPARIREMKRPGALARPKILRCSKRPWAAAYTSSPAGSTAVVDAGRRSYVRAGRSVRSAGSRPILPAR